MNAGRDAQDFEFDVAVSFAGDDREFVTDVVSALQDDGVRVFLDSQQQAEMWGHDLVEYFDQIYRIKSRFAVMFVSRAYGEKMWPRHERRSALARGLEQTEPYVLPVRLDDTLLDGLRPTVAYLDARRAGLAGIVEAVRHKVAGEPVVGPEPLDQVPRTEAEQQRLLLGRQPGWEYLYFFSRLLEERDSVEAIFRDHELQYGVPSGSHVSKADFFDWISAKAGDAGHLSATLERLMRRENQEVAFGVPGEPGDPDKIHHLASRWNAVYLDFMKWAARLRGTSVPEMFEHLVELLARFADDPVHKYRRMVDEVVQKGDRIPAGLAAGEHLDLSTTLTLEIPAEVSSAYHAELQRLTAEVEAGSCME